MVNFVGTTVINLFLRRFLGVAREGGDEFGVDARLHVLLCVQGYLAHTKMPTPLGPP